MSKKVKNMIIYTMIIITITTGINFMIMNKIYTDKIKENEQKEFVQGTQDILTMKCDFENNKEIICE